MNEPRIVIIEASGKVGTAGLAAPGRGRPPPGARLLQWQRARTLGLPYVRFSPDDFLQGVMQTGGSANFAARFLELMLATDAGLLNHHRRTAESTTPTTLEAFVEDTFLPAWRLAA